jgi:ATP-binding cassette, subfamily F, member 3
MIQINQISKFFGDHLLFDGVNLNFSAGERVGFVGRNGSGKSTLFKIILNKLASDAGNIIIPKGYKIGYLEQHIEFKEKTVIEECATALTGDDQYSFYLAESILMGLGFESEDFTKDPHSFSGGYQVRINLAKALVGRPNMLLLDEPTNYLDIISIRWLKNFLRSFDGEVMIITHDRDFMDSVVTHIMGITRRKIKKIKGTTSKFYEQLSMEDEVYKQTKDNFDRRKKELQLFADRFKAKASKASQAQSKLKEIARMGEMDDLSQESDMGFSFHYKDCPGKVILSTENLSFSYDGAQASYLFEGLNIDIKKQDRIGIIGKNGKGKSTLLNVLAEELQAVTGKVTTHPSLLKGHFGQTNISRLHVKNTIIDEISESNPALGHANIRSICGAMLFSGEKAEKKIAVLSGGERSRVLLGKILAHPTNLLILDEPTNHLDMESIQILTEEIKAYKGALIIVTHSEELLRSLVNKLIVFKDNKAEVFNGNYEDFLEKIGWDDETDLPKSKKVKSTNTSLSKKEYKKLRQEIIQERSKTCNPLKKKAAELENVIMKREEEMEQLNQQLINASQSGEGEIISELSQQIGKIQIFLVDVYEELDIYSTKLEKLNNYFESKLIALED